MPVTFLKILSFLLLAIGETLPISAEVWVAKISGVAHIPFFEAFSKTIFIHALGSVFLIAGYIIGYRAFQNIWVVNVITIGLIVMIEPLVMWIIMQQLPTTGAFIGLILGFAGLISATLF